MAEKTKTFDVSFVNRPVVNINTTGITDNANDSVVVSWGNVYYGVITQINTSNFKYRGNKIVWQAFGY